MAHYKLYFDYLKINQEDEALEQYKIYRTIVKDKVVSKYIQMMKSNLK